MTLMLMSRPSLAPEQEGGAEEPAWLAAQTEKTWLDDVVGNVVNDLDPGGDVFDFHEMLEGSYGGGTRCNHRSSLIVHGGGHASTNFNGTAEVRFDTDTPLWALTTTYTNGTSNTTDETYSDGSPGSHHMIDMMTDRTDSNSTYLLAMIARTFQGSGFPSVWEYNHSTGVRTKRADHSGLTTNFTNSFGCTGLYDPTNDLHYFVSQYGGIVRYNPTTHAVAGMVTSSAEMNFDCSGHVWPAGRCAAVYRSDSNELWVANLDDMGDGFQGPIALTGGADGARGAGITWHNPSGGFLVWGQSANRQNIFKLSPPTLTPASFGDLLSGWTFTTVTPHVSNAVTPSAPSNEGTFRRFALIEDVGGSGRDICAVANRGDEPTYVYKLPAGGV